MKHLALALLVCCALVLPACGGGTVVVAGASSITVLSITGGPFITVTPTVFQVTGTEFAQAAGTDAIVRFTAENGVLAFNGGTSNTLDVPVTILDDGTVEGTTPSFLFPGIFNAFVTVILPGTAEGTSETAIAQFIGIQVDSSTPDIVPSDSQIQLDIGGTGFSPPAGNVNVTFIAEIGTPFLNGTTDMIGPVPGTVNSLSSILANAPIAGVNVNAPAFISVQFVDLPGMPVIQSLNPVVTFVPPTVDSTSIIMVPSEIPTAMTITGTGYGPVASNVNVTLTADVGTPFLNGTAASIDVIGTVTSNTTIDITTPIFQVATSTQPTQVAILLNSGAGGASVGPLFSVDRPTVDSVDLANVPSEVPTLLTITGTGFAPNASAPTVRFRAPTGTPFTGGVAFLDVTGTVVNDTTITCTTPRAGISAAQVADIGVFLTTGITEILSAAPLVTFDPPTIGSVSPTMVESEIPETVTITGTGYGSATGLANVTLSGAGTPFTLGTVASLQVTGTITSPTTITFTSPISGVLADLNADVTLDFPTGASVTSAALLTIKTPTVTASSLANVPSEIPTAITVTGTGFAGGAPTVRFTAPSGTPFLGGTASFLDVAGTLTSPTTVTCTTPRAGVSAAQAATIQVRLTGGLNPTSAGNLITFDPPTIASLSPTMVESEIPETVTITGTGFGSVSGNVNVVLSAAGNQFSLGTLPSLTLLGTITSPTTIDFTSPVSGALADINADTTLDFATGSSVTSAAALLIKTPTVTASSLANVPSEIPTGITITGTGFAGGAPTVRFIASSGTPFLGGTASFLDVPGTLTSPTTVTCTTPRAGVSAAQAAQIQVRLTGGLNPTSTGNLITFDPPTISSLSPTMVESEIPETVTITGTGFGSASGNVNVRLSGAGTPFSTGTLPSLTVLGTITSPTTIDFTTPVCGVLADLNADVSLDFATGASVTSVGALLIKTPTVTASSLANVPSEIPTAITITGTGFAGGAPTVRFIASSGTPFLGGTASFLDVTGTITSPTTVTCTTPRAGVSIAQAAQIQVRLTGGLNPTSTGNLITFDPPTIASISPTMVESEIPQLVTLTGTGFGSASGTCNVTLSGPGTPFSTGTLPSLTVLGTITSPTTIVFVSPICGVLPDLNADVTATFTLTGASVTSTGLLLIKAPTVLSCAPPTVDSEDPTAITITGTGFAGGTPNVIFRNATSPFLGGTANNIVATGVTLVNPTTITCTTPRAGVLANTGAQIEVQLTGGLNPISAGNIKTFTAPTVTSCAPTQIDATTATLVTVTGTGFYAPGTVTMRFIAATGTPFSGSATLDVTGTVVNPTTVTGTTPSLVLTNKVVCSVAIVFASGAAPTSGPGCTTFEVPPVAVNDSYGVDGNVQLSVNAANGVIMGVGTDSDPDGDPITVSAFDAASVQGGTVAVAADGAFTYDPPVGYTGPDSFTYTITDGFLFDTATVSLTVSGMVWFVDENATSAGDGRFTTPFDTLAAFIASPLDVAGDTIFLYSSATDYTGNLTLLTNQILLGQGVDLVHPGGNSPSPLVASSSNPTMDSTTGTTLTLGSGNTVRGLDIDSTAGAALLGTTLGALTVNTVNLAATGGPAIDFNGTGTLAVTFGTVSSTGSSSDGIRIQGVGGSMASGTTTINNCGVHGINLGSSAGTFTFASAAINTTLGRGIFANALTGGLQVTGSGTITGAGGRGVDVTGGTPDVDFGSLTVTTAGSEGIFHGGAGTFGVSGATTITGAIDGINHLSSGDLDFANITISGHTATGIRIDATGPFTSSGTVAILGGDEGVQLSINAASDVDFNILTITSPLNDGIFINGAAGTFDVTGRCNIVTPGNDTTSPGLDHGIDIDGGSIAVTFADLDIVDSHGHGVEISNTSGAISITGDLGAGPESSDIHNTDDVGIHCTTCTGTLTFRDLFIDDSGDGASNGQESHGIRIDDCTGAIVIDGCLIDDCAETPIGDGLAFDNNCIHVRMDDGGTLSSLQITDCTFSGTESGGLGTTTDHGVFIRLEGGSVISDVDITGCLCSDVGRAFVEVLIDGDDSGDGPVISNLNVSDNGTAANPIETQAEGIHLRNNGTSVLPVFNFDRNIINGGSLSRGNAIRINLGEFPTGVNATGTATGTCNENDIDLVGDGANDNGIDTQTQNDCNLILEIDDNDIDGGSDNGMRIRGFDTSDTQITVTNNDIGLNTVHLDAAVEVQTRSGSPVLCIDIDGNDAHITDVYRMIRDAGTFRLLNIGAGTHSAAQVDTFIEGQNTGNATSTSGGYTQCTTISTP